MKLERKYNLNILDKLEYLSRNSSIIPLNEFSEIIWDIIHEIGNIEETMMELREKEVYGTISPVEKQILQSGIIDLKYIEWKIDKILERVKSNSFYQMDKYYHDVKKLSGMGCPEIEKLYAEVKPKYQKMLMDRIFRKERMN